MSKKQAFLDNIPFSIPAGGALPLPAGNWDFIYIAELNSDADLLVESASFRVPMIVGRRVEVADSMVGVVQITNRGSVSAVGVLYVGSGDIRDSTVVGTVAVVNDNKSRTERGEAFFNEKSQPAVAAKYSISMIANPAGSGKRLIVNRLIGGAWAGSGSMSMFTSKDYESLELELAVSFTGSKTAKGNKLISGSDGVGLLRTLVSTSASPINLFSVGTMRVNAPGMAEYKFTEPVIILPGESMGVIGHIVNEQIDCNIEWFEEST